MSIWYWLAGGPMISDKWDCKWIKPSEQAWWEWQSCLHPDNLCQNYMDCSCNFEKGCDLFEKKEEK